jgi:hypothetical protein
MYFFIDRSRRALRRGLKGVRCANARGFEKIQWLRIGAFPKHFGGKHHVRHPQTIPRHALDHGAQIRGGREIAPVAQASRSSRRGARSRTSIKDALISLVLRMFFS